jgi:folate-binding protein YgfZ
MLKPLTETRRHTRLANLGVVRVQGPDAVKFLQGQLSNDVAKLADDRSVLAGLHNAQGRAIALLRLVRAGPDEIVAVVPRELAASVAARLAKFVLRAKAKVSDASGEWEVAGVEAAGIADGLGDVRVGAARREEDGSIWVCAGLVPTRWLVLNRTSVPTSPSRLGEAMTPDDWLALDIADGVPQVYAATSEAFVAQMLNLDVVGGIAFDKGCYTGQEVIARAHYRGKVKRRMQRFRTTGSASLKVGDSGTLTDGRGFKVVEAVGLADGRYEFLAVAPIAGAELEETAAPAATGAPAIAAAPARAQPQSQTDSPPIAAESLPLPYSLPL